MFTHIIVQPIFNLLVLIYALLPGHNFGFALIIFTIVIRLLLWPLVRKQLHQTKAMRKLQPEMKRIKKETKGNRQKESQMLMELYKQKGINPLGTFPTLIVQFIVLIGLYSGLRKVIANPHNLVTFAYPSLQRLSWMKMLAKNIHLFDNTLFGIVNLSKPAFGTHGLYLPALVIVLGSALAQYYQSKQLLPDAGDDKRSLRTIMKEAGKGNQADQSEVNAAVGRSTRYLLPVFIFIFTVDLAAALSLYWLTGGIAAFIQQSIVLRGDETEMEALADSPSKNVAAIPEAEIVDSPVAAAAVSPKQKPVTKVKPKAKAKVKKSVAKRKKR
jgi:YidC/Oxa1 family membrane protein insertase